MKKRENFYLVFLMVICSIFLTFAFFCLQALQKGFQIHIVFFFIGFVAAALFIGWQFTHYLRHMDYEKEVLIEKERLQEECRLEMKKEQKELEELEQNISQYMKHIEELLERAAVDETKDYAGTILEECSQKRWKKMCNRPLLDAVLHSKAEICEENNIDFEVNSYIPENIAFSEAEMISVYHNLLNNAIEACMRMDEGEMRWITLRSGIKSGFFILQIENTRKRNEKIGGKTWKKDKASHGLGKKIVKDIVEKYNGDCLFEKKRDSYSVIISVAVEEN